MLMRRPAVWARGTWFWLYVRGGRGVGTVGPSIGERSQVAHGVHSGEEEVCTARQCGERWNTLVHSPDRPFGYGEVRRAVLGAADRIALVVEFMESLVVDPHVLCEFELTHQVCADD